MEFFNAVIDLTKDQVIEMALHGIALAGFFVSAVVAVKFLKRL